MTVVINFAWLFKLAAAFFAKLPRIFPGSGSSNCNNDNGSKKERDPFEVLGLKKEDNPTIEDATKARRKLALKWHPGELCYIFLRSDML